VLESLELEYRREEDWCGGHDKLGSMAETDHVSPLINKHLEQKEAFLKVHLTPTHAQTQNTCNNRSSSALSPNLSFLYF